jgi:thioredoxin 1
METLLSKYISADKFVLVDFTAEWCEPCKWVMPILEEVEKHFKGKIKLVKIDIDTNAELARSMHILSVPTLVLFTEEKEVWRMRGFEPAPALIKTLEKHLI